MQKKLVFISLIIIIVITIILTLPCTTYKQQKFQNTKSQMREFQYTKKFSEPIKTQYKKEIEQILNEEIPKSKNLIDNISIEIKNEKDTNIKQTIIDYGITDILFKFYSKLIDVTDKYVNIKSKVPATDWYIELQELVTPYLQDNDVNMTQIKSLLEYAEESQKAINKQHFNQ